MNRGVIDIGNTRIKAAVFNPEGLLLEKTICISPAEATDWMRSKGIVSVIAASVGQQILPGESGLNLISLTHESKLPFENLYERPETLGVDRIAAMAAAAHLYPGRAVLVFDIGTCMTIDLLQPDNIYKGGNISPGLDMRLKAMHQMTGRLPLVSHTEAVKTLGRSTHAAIASGAVSGMRHEIEGYIRSYSELYPGLVTVLCGGDHMHFEFPSENRIFADPNFVLQGLFHLLLLNEK
jgi:type III pantothenate kinase